MTPRERAKEATWEAGCPDWGSDDQERLEKAVERAITAAVEEDRKTRPHEFVGRSDRWCELCGEPDRDARHYSSPERVVRSIALAVEEEREACAEIARKVRANTVRDWVRQTSIDIEALIRARSTASTGETK